MSTSWPVWAAFVAASGVLAVTPGPGVLYIVTRTLSQGRRAGLASVAGVALGNFGNALAASLGLAALLALSSAAFDAIRLAGAAWLVWLGIQALRTPAVDDGNGADPGPADRVLRDGVVVALLNPKTALFFGAFLPQFIDPRTASPSQSVWFGLAFVAIAACTDTVYVLAAAAVAPLLAGLRRASAWGRWLTGAIYLGLGLWAAFSDLRVRR